MQAGASSQIFFFLISIRSCTIPIGMSGDADGPHDSAAALTWEIVCTCRRVSPSPAAVVALLRRLPGGLTLANQRWFVAHCVDDPLGAAFPRGAEVER